MGCVVCGVGCVVYRHGHAVVLSDALRCTSLSFFFALTKVEFLVMLPGLLDEPGSSTSGRRCVHPIVGHHKSAEPVSFDRFGHGQASRQALKTVIFRLQSLSRHSKLVVWRSSRGGGSGSLVFFNSFSAI